MLLVWKVGKKVNIFFNSMFMMYNCYILLLNKIKIILVNIRSSLKNLWIVFKMLICFKKKIWWLILIYKKVY